MAKREESGNDQLLRGAREHYPPHRSPASDSGEDDAVLPGPAAAAVAAVVLVPGEPEEPRTYISNERGPVPIEAMHRNWAHNAAGAVKQGRRPLDNRPGMVKALERQAKGHTN